MSDGSRKITILLKLLGDYDSAEIVTKGKHINDRNPTKLVKKLQEQLANELMGRGENNRPIIFEEEVKPVLLATYISPRIPKGDVATRMDKWSDENGTRIHASTDPHSVDEPTWRVA
eukprot:COSAG02_NODE_30566_length_548_cov_25.690423_1_plen_116_part_10